MEVFLVIERFAFAATHAPVGSRPTAFGRYTTRLMTGAKEAKTFVVADAIFFSEEEESARYFIQNGLRDLGRVFAIKRSKQQRYGAG